MKEKISICLFFAILMSMLLSCVTNTNVTFNTDIPGADIYVDGEYIGKTPVTTKVSNAIWEDPDVIIKKEGYQNMHLGLKKDVKIINLVCGLLLWWPSLLWSYGPKEQQYYMLSLIK